MKTYTAPCLTLLLACALSCALFTGCSSYRDPEQAHGMLGAPVSGGRTDFGHNSTDRISTGLLAPNGSGNTMIVSGSRGEPPVYAEEAYELKLKARELAAQMLETRDNQALVGLIAMPASFVNLDDLNESTPLGRYLAESMFYEFNQRGFPVREYRLTSAIALREGTGELAISRELPPVSAKQSWAALLIGTYQRDASAIFINARLVRATDGLVLRTAQLVLPRNGIMARMTTNPPKPPFATGSLHIK